MNRLLPLFLVLFLTGFATAEAPTRDTHERLHSVLWVQTAPEFRVSCEQVFRLGAAHLNEALEDPFWTAATEQTGDYFQLPPAVVFDIDETVLDNSPFQARLAADRVDYVHEEWGRWVSEAQADPLPGAAHFVKLLRARGVTPIFASNRSAEQKAATVANLREALEYPDLKDDQVLLKGGKPEWGSDKTSRREELVKEYRILFLFGDVYEDFVELGDLAPEQRVAKAQEYSEHWGVRWYLLPNPSYGTWERALYDYGADKQVLKRKFEALNTKR